MLKIGLIGADSFHALAFAKLANLPVNEGGCGVQACINAIWGENAERAGFVAEQAKIPLIVTQQEALLGIVDAVMIVTRNGENHLKEAAPFIKSGIPAWVDKPFACTLQDAEAIIKLADENKAFIAGGSFCKYCPDILDIRNELMQMGGIDNLFGAHFNFPAQRADPWGGLHFYAPHTAEILSTIFGCNIRSIKADENNGNIIAIFKYDTFSVSVNFAQVSDFSCVLYGKSSVVTHKIDIAAIYRIGFEKVVSSIISNNHIESTDSLIWPVKIVNALIEAVDSQKEIAITL